MSTNLERDTERELSAHIFAVSAQLVGICLTVIGLIRALVRVRGVGRFADDLLAVAAFTFLGACAFAYASLHSRRNPQRRRLERVADFCFGVALLLMTTVCAIITWAVV